jgi:hypothetical protein
MDFCFLCFSDASLGVISGVWHCMYCVQAWGSHFLFTSHKSGFPVVDQTVENGVLGSQENGKVGSKRVSSLN